MEIVELSRKEYQDYELVFDYVTTEIYKVQAISDETGFQFKLSREPLPEPMHKSFSENLFQRYLINPSVYAIFEGEEPVAIMEVDREFWNKRLRIADLVVKPIGRRKGYGAALIEKAKMVAEAEEFRAVFLDTHSCNTPAIDFYIQQGFHLSGLDTSFYSNKDIERDEVWVQMTYTLKNDFSDNWRYPYTVLKNAEEL